jgi:adenosylmethionine---8-amino-7-oxononanoate aminotransferase
VNGDDLLARDARVLWHPLTQHGLEAAPLPVVAARGATLVLADGREILDGIASWWSCLHGHGRPEIGAAIAEQAARLDHVLLAGATHEPAVRLAERLIALAPSRLERVFYSDDGSTAVEVALKMVVQFHLQRGQPDRRVFVVFEGGYHGDTVGAMALSDPDPYFVPFEPLLFRAERVALDASVLREALARLGPLAAGVVIEPLVQGAAGMRMHSAEFLRGVRAAADEFGVPLIADEVMTGFGRTGALFASAKAGIAPDLLCLSKGLTGGTLPLAATLATRSIYEAFLATDRRRAFFHGHTYTGNPIACAAALASLDLIERENTPQRLEHIGATIEARLRERFGDPHHAVRIVDLRRLGGIVAIELKPVTGTASYFDHRALAMRQIAIDHGVLLRPLGNVIYAIPPSCVTAAECARIADAMFEASRAA